MIKVGIIGFGGIAQAHKNAYKILEAKGVPIKLSALCDIEPEKFKGKVRINITENMDDANDDLNAACYTDVNEMHTNESLDMVDICLPTPFHASMAINMLEKGYHVLSEKPMARSYSDCLAMLNAANKAGRQLMIGQCLRFYPQYQYLKETIDSGRYGTVISAFFERLSGPPIWGFENWFMDVSKSGGCMLDMHIHDIDMARYLFGEPMEVSCNARNVYSGYDTVNTRLFYDDKLVCATGDWSLPNPFGFRHGYRINLEKAALVFDNNEVTVFEKDGTTYKPNLSGLDGITNEIAYFTDVIENNRKNIVSPAESAAITVKLIETMKKSADANGAKEVFYK